jgi:ABC-type proline/glycine betaine transport system permease subunit
MYAGIDSITLFHMYYKSKVKLINSLFQCLKIVMNNLLIFSIAYQNKHHFSMIYFTIISYNNFFSLNVWDIQFDFSEIITIAFFHII